MQVGAWVWTVWMVWAWGAQPCLWPWAGAPAGGAKKPGASGEAGRAAGRVSGESRPMTCAGSGAGWQPRGAACGAVREEGGACCVAVEAIRRERLALGYPPGHHFFALPCLATAAMAASISAWLPR